MAIGGITEKAGDDATRAATGRDHAGWFAVLDEAGAASWTHGEIAAWLADVHGVPPWWTQNVTVAYEQSRGMREPGQQADGTFAASRSRTVRAAPDAVYEVTLGAFSARYGQPASARAEGRRPYARWRVPDDTGILATVEGMSPGRTRISVVHEKLPDAAATGPAKDALGAVLDEVATTFG